MSSDETQTEATATEASDTLEADAASDNDEASDDDDAADADEKAKKKAAKEAAKAEKKAAKEAAKEAEPKKVKIDFEAVMPRNEAVSYFEAIIAGLKSGRLEFKQEGEALILNPPDHLGIEVKASRKGDKGKVVFEIEWSDEARGLEIVG